MELATNSRPSEQQKPAGSKLVGKSYARARASNKPSAPTVDGRSQIGRRVRDLAEDFASQLGGWRALSDTMAANVRKAAELTALAEQTRAEALRNGNVDPLALVRLEGAADRAVRRLGIKPGKTARHLSRIISPAVPRSAIGVTRNDEARRHDPRRLRRLRVVRAMVPKRRDLDGMVRVLAHVVWIADERRR